ncbi:hypothetical protein BC936DRAFT_136867 [Jimgerdemannia flammicorona]|uniref:Uncharacterized protein n=1 Tax=Jimgerdemannia flammicorona TaxID=994334 RepID=A0A433CYL2_9FUNG|nr:hypothetical protein BC936DRAFT_136867 [Jimgerdemannia flammicorona]
MVSIVLQLTHGILEHSLILPNGRQTKCGGGKRYWRWQAVTAVASDTGGGKRYRRRQAVPAAASSTGSGDGDFANSIDAEWKEIIEATKDAHLTTSVHITENVKALCERLNQTRCKLAEIYSRVIFRTAQHTIRRCITTCVMYTTSPILGFFEVPNNPLQDDNNGDFLSVHVLDLLWANASLT